MHVADLIQPENFRRIHEKAKYTDFNGNEVKLTGEFEAATKYDEKFSITKWKAIDGTKEPIIGMDNIAALGIQIITGGETTTIRRLTDNTEELRQTLIDKHRDLFENNHTVKELEVRIQLKPGHKPVQQKGRRIPIHLQKAVTKEIKKLINAGHLTRINDIK